MVFPFPAHQRDPVPPVSPPAWETPHGVGNVGTQYGTQSRGEWAAGDNEEKQVVDALRAVSLWRVSIFGAVLLKIQWGTSSLQTVLNIEAPLVATFPGQVQIYAKPADPEHAGTVGCFVTLTPATAGARAHWRKQVTGPVAFDDAAVSFTALDACSLTISGIVTAVAALATVPLVAGSSLTSGSGFQEFEA